MASLPNQVYYAEDHPFFLPYTMNPNFSTVVIQGGPLQVVNTDAPPGAAAFGVGGDSNTMNLVLTYSNQTFNVQATSTSIVTSQTSEANNLNIISITNGLAQTNYGFTSNSQEPIINAFTGNPGGLPPFVGAITFMSTISGGVGGGGIKIGNQTGVNSRFTQYGLVNDGGVTVGGGGVEPYMFQSGFMGWNKTGPTHGGPSVNDGMMEFIDSRGGGQGGFAFLMGDDNTSISSLSTCFWATSNEAYLPGNLELSTVNGYAPYKYAVVQEPDGPAMLPVFTGGGTQAVLFDFPSTITGHTYRVTLSGQVGLNSNTPGDKIWIYLSGGGEGITPMWSLPVESIPSVPGGLFFTCEGVYNDTNGAGFGVLINSQSAANGAGASGATWTFTGGSCYIENLGPRQPLPSTIW